MAQRTETVRVTVYIAPQSLPAKVEEMNAKMEAMGWKIQGFSTGSTEGFFPRYITVKWVYFYRDGKSAKDDLIKARGGVANTYFEAWTEWTSQVSEQVVVQSAKDAAQIAQDAVPKIAFGFGAVLALVAVLAGAYVYVRYAKK